MNEKLPILKYTFTVEGETEQWYLYWLRDQINSRPDKEVIVAFDVKVQQSPAKFYKGVTKKTAPKVTHICDDEIIVTGTKYKVQKIEGTNKEKIKELRKMLKHPPAFGGTYWPDPYSMLGAHTCLEKMYYIPGVGIDCELETYGDFEEVPYIPGAIY